MDMHWSRKRYGPRAGITFRWKSHTVVTWFKFQHIQGKGRGTMMTKPTNDPQQNFGDKTERAAKGGVAGTDSKDFASEDIFKKDPEPAQKKTTTNSNAS